MKGKRLTKGKDKIIAGVCSGIAEYLGLDVTLVRLVYAFLVVLNPYIFILFYILAAIIMPESDKSESESRNEKKLLTILLIIFLLLLIATSCHFVVIFPF